MEKNNQRLMSIDALRGFDMLFIMGFSGLVVAICSLFPEGADCWLARTMSHVQWNGLAHHDTIFPLFLFLAGMSFPFSYAKQVSLGTPKSKIYMKVIKRALILFLFGLVYNNLLKFDLEKLRVCSVLGRIGIAWMFAAILYINFNAKIRAIIASAILIGYWLLVRYVAAPDFPGADPLSLEGNIVGYVDRMVTPGILHVKNIFDPEGLLSTLPAIVTAMLGIFTGEFVRLPEEKISGKRKTLYMAGAALGMLAVGLLWSLDLPINKNLWTSSFVLVVGAYSVGMFALFYYIIDVKKWQKWTTFFTVIGMNSITIYMAQRIINFGNANRFLFEGFAGLLPEQWGAVVMKAGYVAVCWLFLYFLYKKKIFLKV
jgi:predicted acyltransferase